MNHTAKDILTSNQYPVPNDVIQDGKIHRFGNAKRYWYICHENYIVAEDWKNELPKIKQFINSDTKKNTRTKEEWERIKKNIAESKLKYENELKAKYEKASVKAQKVFSSLSNTGHSEYLSKKQVRSFGIRFKNKNIFVPLRDINKKLWSIQKIMPNGNKRFMPKGKKKGNFHLIGRLSKGEPIYFCEGYATACSIYMATRQLTIICFDAGNIEQVVIKFRQKFPNYTFIIAGDEDKYGKVNTGRIKALSVAKKYNCKVLFPKFKDESTKPTDFNDLFVLEGINKTRRQLKCNNFITPIKYDFT